jgi:hypothetical protein
MDIFETGVEMARRHVAEAERLVHRQRSLVAALGRRGRDVEAAEKTLAVFETTLDAMRQRLALEEALAYSPRWNGSVARTLTQGNLTLPARLRPEESACEVEPFGCPSLQGI